MAETGREQSREQSGRTARGAGRKASGKRAAAAAVEGSPADAQISPPPADTPPAARASTDTAPTGAKPARRRTAPSPTAPSPTAPTPDDAPATPPADPRTLPDGPRIGRIPVLAVGPVVEGARWPAKAVVGEYVPITATVFREGHDAVAATAVLIDPDGREHGRARMHLLAPGTDRYGADLPVDREGAWSFRVEAWNDVYGTWEHAATVKIAAEVDVDLMLEEGARVLDRALDGVLAGAPSDLRDRDERALRDAVWTLRDGGRPAVERLAAGTTHAVHEALARTPLREHVSTSPTYPLTVQRKRALFSSWYEMFPRSEGAHQVTDHTGETRWVSGTFATAAQRLPAIAEMGFDIVYLPPIHPVGRVNRKGPNNTLTPGPSDPGSPWAIGAAEGGHDAVHPDLGTIDDFDRFVATARGCGLEVAIDLALQCAPDHPWAREHPQWFTTRADGTIAYAENPPKKYQDIYPINFDNDPAGLYHEVLRVCEHWIAHGVTVFRVDNPHTKPVEFWEWLIGRVNAAHPEVIFLAEAFTRPAMMHTLGKVGFHQSYTYFTWRTTKAELTEYLTELSGAPADYMRPNFWPNTPDILHEFLQYGGPAAFKLRAVLAATMSPCWGMYSGYELCEHVAVRHGSEEYLDSEKYQYKPRDWASYAPGGHNAHRSIAPYITRLNRIRHDHPALHTLRNIAFHATDDDSILCYSKRVDAAQSPTGMDDTLLIVVNLDPHGTRATMVHLDMPALGMDWADDFTVHDLITDESYRWSEHSFVQLDPHHEPAHVFLVRGA